MTPPWPRAKVGNCRGGEDFLIAAAWRRKVENFEPFYLYEGNDTAIPEVAAGLLSR